MSKVKVGKRLQGSEWQEMKPYLKMWGFIVTNNGNIQVFLHHKTKFTSNGSAYRYRHYLNDVEKEKFLASDYYKKSTLKTGTDRVYEYQGHIIYSYEGE